MVPVIESDMENIFFTHDVETGSVSIHSSQKQSWWSFFTCADEDKAISLNIYLPESICGLVRDNASVNLDAQVVAPEYFHLEAQNAAKINFNGDTRCLHVIAENKSKVYLQGSVGRFIVSAWGQSMVSAEFGFAHAAHFMAYHNATVKAQGITSIQGRCADQATVITSVPLQGEINVWYPYRRKDRYSIFTKKKA